MKKKNGFTLIELLTIIILLALIALMVTPIVNSSIEKAKKDSFKASMQGILEAVKINKDYGVRQEYKITNGVVTPKLDIDGKVEGNGTITVTEDGDVSMKISTRKYCATKKNEDKKVRVTEGACE